MARIFIDTGPFVALGFPGDEHHARAKATHQHLVEQGDSLITTNHIVDETCTWLLRKAINGHQAAMKFHASLESAVGLVGKVERSSVLERSPLTLIYSTPDLERLAWDIFAQCDTARFSFTDCVSFAVMQSLGIKKAFTFDKHYDALGFERL